MRRCALATPFFCCPTGIARASRISAVSGFALSVANDAEADSRFAALSDGGQVQIMPLTKTFFSSKFGMVLDRFGVMWMVIVQR